MNPLLTATEVAKILRRPIQSIYELVKSRRLRAILDGRHYKFRIEDIQIYIEQNLLKPSKPLSTTVKKDNPLPDELRDRNGE